MPPHAVITLVGWDVTSGFSAPESSLLQKNKAELWLSCWFDLEYVPISITDNQRREKWWYIPYFKNFFFFFALLTVHWLLLSVSWPKTWNTTRNRSMTADIIFSQLLIAPFQSNDWQKIWKIYKYALDSSDWPLSSEDLTSANSLSWRVSHIFNIFLSIFVPDHPPRKMSQFQEGSSIIPLLLCSGPSWTKEAVFSWRVFWA